MSTFSRIYCINRRVCCILCVRTTERRRRVVIAIIVRGRWARGRGRLRLRFVIIIILLIIIIIARLRKIKQQLLIKEDKIKTQLAYITGKTISITKVGTKPIKITNQSRNKFRAYEKAIDC